MRKVKRFDICAYHEVNYDEDCDCHPYGYSWIEEEESKDGDWVRYKDVKPLAEMIDKLLAENVKLRSQLQVSQSDSYGEPITRHFRD